MNKRTIFVVTNGNRQAAGTKYRIVQYEPFFRENDIHIESVNIQNFNSSHLEQISKSSLFVNQKCLLSPRIAKRILAAQPHAIFDFDDAIYTRPGKPYSWITDYRIKRRLKFWLRHAHVTTANHFLRNYAEHYTNRIDVIPMALDLNLWRFEPKEQSKKEIRIGWAGAPVNHPYLERLEPVLNSLLEQHPDVTLAVYSGRRPKLRCRFEYTPFQDGSEAAFIQSLDVGLLPLTDEEYSRGKSPIKAIQYLACGVPVVGNIFGATAEILNHDNSLSVYSESDWSHALHKLIRNDKWRHDLGQAGRKHIEAHHSLQVAKEKFLKIIKNAMGETIGTMKKMLRSLFVNQHYKQIGR